LKDSFLNNSQLLIIMKILAAGDIHGDVSNLENLMNKAKEEDVDAIILCGDITYANALPNELIKQLTSSEIDVFIIPGNHEDVLTFELLKNLGLKHLHGDSTIINNVAFFGCGFSNIGLSQLTEDEIFSTLKNSHNQVSHIEKKIMVTHVHPSGSKMESFSNFIKGSEGVTKAIKELKPHLLLCSHVHEAEGVEELMHDTTIINVGRTGKIITF